MATPGCKGSKFHLQLVGDAFLSPGGIVCGHLADQRLVLVRKERSARRFDFQRQKGGVSLAVPTQESVLLQIHQRVASNEPVTQVESSAVVAYPSALERGELLSQEEALIHNAAQGRAAK